MQRIKFKIEDDEADKLYKIAKDKKVHVSQLIRSAIKLFIFKESAEL